MSPRKADPAIRTALIEQAAGLIAEEGVRALTLRQLTKSVGVSTMAIYTHFGSMDDLRRAIREEGFARLAARMEAIEQTDDPVADLGAFGWAYYETAITNPNLYRAMFMEDRVPEPDGPVGLDTFEGLVAAVRRCIDAGRFPPVVDASRLATQLWVTGHGVVTLSIAGYLSDAEARRCLADMGRNLVRSFSDDPDSVDRSLTRVLERIDAEEASAPWVAG